MKKDYKHLMWKETGRKIAGKYRIFDTWLVDRELDDRKGQFVMVDSPDWVNIVAVVKNEKGVDCFLMVRQFRHGTGTVSLEFPAGIVDPGEEPIHAAERELREETGYKASKITLMGVANPNCAFMNNTNYSYLAEGLEKIYDQDLDADEKIDVVLVPVDEAAEGFGHGDMMNAICMLSHYFYIRAMDKKNNS